MATFEIKGATEALENAELRQIHTENVTNMTIKSEKNEDFIGIVRVELEIFWFHSWVKSWNFI